MTKKELTAKATKFLGSPPSIFKTYKKSKPHVSKENNECSAVRKRDKPIKYKERNVNRVA